jgi:protein-tyrosine phosphatase
MDRRSAEALAARGYDPSLHRAQQVSADWFAREDVLLAMDEGHRSDLVSFETRSAHTSTTDGSGTDPSRVRLFGDFDPATPGVEVPDPYYGDRDGFEEVLDMIERTCRALVPHIERALSPS